MKKNTKKLLNIAHRGARAVAPENTLVAGRKAYEAGADMWEFDVQLTADKKFVVVHDETLARTTDVEKIFADKANYRVDNFKLSEIKKLDAGSWFEREDPFGEIKKNNVSSEDLKTYRGIRVPTLREVLELTRELGWRANIELKSLKGQAGPERPRGEVLRELVDLVEGLGLMDDVMVSAFDHVMIRELKNLNSSITGALLIEDPITRPVECLKVNDVKIYNVCASVLESEQGRRNIRDVNEAGAGYRVNVWTVNGIEEMEELFANPFVDGVITDYPGRLSRVLSRAL